MRTKKILEVSEIKLEIQKTNPPKLVIRSRGKVTTGGWTNGRLIPYIYVHPPIDGMYEFGFIADAPTDPSTQAITPIDAEPYVWENYPMELKGVIIYSSSNSKTAKL